MLNFRKWKISVPIEQQLYTAVESNNSNEIKAILNKKPTIINKPYEKYDNRTILLLACGRIKNVRTEIIELLLNSGANINFSHQSDLHWSCLHHAIANNERDIAELLLKKEPNLLNIRNYDGSNALHIAVKNTVRSCGEDEACECIKFLIEKGINVNQLNRYNETPIFVACRFNYKKVIQTILNEFYPYKPKNIKKKLTHKDSKYNSGNNVNAKTSFEKSVESVSEKKKQQILDLDFPCKKKSSARHLMKCKELYDGELPKETKLKWEDYPPLVLLRGKDEDNYLKHTKKNEADEKLRYKELLQKIPTMENDGIETPLQIACRLNLTKVIKFLLQKKADSYKSTTSKNEELLIQITTDNGHQESFKLLLNKFDSSESTTSKNEELPIQITTDNGQLESFKLSLKKLYSSECTTSKNEELPIQITTDNGHQESFKLLLKKVGSSESTTSKNEELPIQITTDNGQLESFKLSLKKLDSSECTTSKNQELPIQITTDNGHLKSFKLLFKKVDSSKSTTSKNEEVLIQITTDNGPQESFKLLLNKVVSYESTTSKNEELPIQITIDNGHLESFKLLLKQYKIDEKSIPYQSVIKMCYNEHNNRLLQHFLQEISRDSSNLVKLNEQNSDDHNSTIVHYIVTCTDHKEARKFLTKGASLAVRNDYGRMPIDDIHPKLLEDHLDDCFSNMYSRKAPNFRLFDCNFKSILLPQETSDNLVVSYKNKKLSTKKSNRGVKIEDEEGHKKLLNANFKSSKIEDKECLAVKIEDDYSSGIKSEELNSKKYFLQSDTDVIFSMSQNSQLKHLLQHPLSLTFLYLKYQRFHKYLIGNLVFNIILSMALAIVPFFKPILIFFFIAVLILILRQCLYLFIFVIVNLNYKFKRVRSIFQNISHITFIVLLIFLIFFNYKKKEICAFAILLSVVEILLTPDFGGLTHLIILRKVLVNFFYLLIVFIFLILAFALSFFVVFQKKSNSKEEVNQEEEDKTVSFSTFSKSVFKTFIMVTGEFDAGSIQFSLVSQIIFVFFIFIIYIVLMNLLNGLAVTDVQDIKRDAELDHLKVRVECIHFIEKIILSLPNGRRHYTEWCSVPLQLKMEIEMFGERCIKLLTINEEICDRTTKRLLLNNRLTLFKNAVKIDENRNSSDVHKNTVKEKDNQNNKNINKVTDNSIRKQEKDKSYSGKGNKTKTTKSAKKNNV